MEKYRGMKFKNKVVNYISILFVIFFGYTAFNKLLNINSFQHNLLKTGLFADYFVVSFSFIVILCELIVIFFLIFYSKIGFLLVVMMMTGFTIYISYLNYSGLYEICGCGGILNGLAYKYHLLINVLILLSAIFCSTTIVSGNEN